MGAKQVVTGSLMSPGTHPVVTIREAPSRAGITRGPDHAFEYVEGVNILIRSALPVGVEVGRPFSHHLQDDWGPGLPVEVKASGHSGDAGVDRLGDSALIRRALVIKTLKNHFTYSNMICLVRLIGRCMRP